MAKADKLANNVLIVLKGKEYYYIEKEFRRFILDESNKDFVIGDTFKKVNSICKARWVQENEMSDRYKEHHEF